MQITQTEFKKLADEVYYDEAPVIAIDFETNGLNPYDRDEAFVIGIAYQDRTFSYFLTDQFKDGNILARLLGNSKGAYLAHNAKFEMSFLLNQWGVQISGVVWDTEVFAKTLNNSYGKKTGGTGYGLQACAERIGLSKYPPMLAWLKKKGNKHAYHKAPKDLIIPYVEQDAYLSLALYKEQVAQFNEWQKGPVPIGDIVKLEMTTTKSLFQMERRGLLLDLEYCREALGYERGKAERAKERFKDITGCEFSDSGKLFTKIFDERGVKYAMTAPTKRFPNGQPSFAEESLEAMGDEPVAQCIRDYRTANKRASTYWGNFITGSPNGEVHPNIKQTGADTFRMSVINPACQTWPRDDEDDLNYPIRRAFKAKPNCKVLSMDYRQMELRMMADESGDKDMIQAIMEGQDLHQKTADIAGVKRSLAKNGRFAKQYGAGFKRIAETLKIDLSLATRIAKAIDEAFPQVTAYTRELISFASQAPFGYNWAGRRYYLDKRFAYKFPNYRIQGGCAEVLRIAIRDIDALFLNVKVHEDTYMMMPIHDELTFNIHESDFYLIPQIKECMINAWKGKHLMMDVSVEWGSNLYDLEKYVGDSVQNARHEGLEIDVPKGVHPQDTGEITQGSTGHTCLH